MRVALFDDNGLKLETSLDGGPVASEHVVLLKSDTAVFNAFDGVASSPRPSLNRGFSAPIRLTDDDLSRGRSCCARQC